MRRTLPWLTAMLFIGCLALGYLYFQQKRNSAASDSDRQKQIAQLQKQLAAAKDSLAEADKLHAEALKAAAARPATAEAPKPAARRKRVQISDILKEHPEFADVYAKQMRRSVNNIYGEGLNKLNLAPDQMKKLRGLLADRQMSQDDAMQAALAAGVVPVSAEWNEAVKQAGQSTEEGLTALLGPNADATLSQIQSDAGKAQAQQLMANQVVSISSDFADAGIPLTPEQSTGLTNALVSAWYWNGRDLSDRPTNYNDPDPDTGLSIHDTRNLNAATSVLTPDQLQVYKNYELQIQQLMAMSKQYQINPGMLFSP